MVNPNFADLSDGLSIRNHPRGRLRSQSENIHLENQILCIGYPGKI